MAFSGHISATLTLPLPSLRSCGCFPKRQGVFTRAPCQAVTGGGGRWTGGEMLEHSHQRFSLSSEGRSWCLLFPRQPGHCPSGPGCPREGQCGVGGTPRGTTPATALGLCCARTWERPAPALGLLVMGEAEPCSGGKPEPGRKSEAQLAPGDPSSGARSGAAQVHVRFRRTRDK